MLMAKLDPDERRDVHTARVDEICSGEISGDEFVCSLVNQVGLSTLEAKACWQALKDDGKIAIYDRAQSRCMVEYPFPIARDNRGYPRSVEYRRGMITAIYAKDGAIVQTGENVFSMRVPFSLFELRLAK